MKIKFFAPLLLLLLTQCHYFKQPTLYTLLKPSSTGVTFANTITEDDSLNILNFVYLYNGAGVATGDVNNDGFTDLYFGGNMVSSKLYLNKGNFKFEDITLPAKVGTKLSFGYLCVYSKATFQRRCA
jgi:hypothetical protein